MVVVAIYVDLLPRMSQTIVKDKVMLQTHFPRVADVTDFESDRDSAQC